MRKQRIAFFAHATPKISTFTAVFPAYVVEIVSNCKLCAIIRHIIMLKCHNANISHTANAMAIAAQFAAIAASRMLGHHYQCQQHAAKLFFSISNPNSSSHSYLNGNYEQPYQLYVCSIQKQCKQRKTITNALHLQNTFCNANNLTNKLFLLPHPLCVHVLRFCHFNSVVALLLGPIKSKCIHNAHAIQRVDIAKHLITI